jgi:hypothetical protein
MRAKQSGILENLAKLLPSCRFDQLQDDQSTAFVRVRGSASVVEACKTIWQDWLANAEGALQQHQIEQWAWLPTDAVVFRFKMEAERSDGIVLTYHSQVEVAVGVNATSNDSSANKLTITITGESQHMDSYKVRADAIVAGTLNEKTLLAHALPYLSPAQLLGATLPTMQQNLEEICAAKSAVIIFKEDCVLLQSQASHHGQSLSGYFFRAFPPALIERETQLNLT